MIGIYRITSPNNRIYIGQSIDVKKRFKDYRVINRVRAQCKLYNSLNKYGIDSHKFEIICECTREQLNELEKFYIELYDSVKNGLNMKVSGRFGYLSEESKNKIRGRKHTEEAKRKMKGRKFSDTHIKNLMGRKCMNGKKHSLLTKEKMSLSSPLSKIVLNVQTGIFYNSTEDAAKSIGIGGETLRRKLVGQRKNNTQLIYA